MSCRTHYQPSSLYNLSFAKFITNLSFKSTASTMASFEHSQLDCLPRNIQQDFHHRVTLCGVCGKLHIVDETFLVVRTTKEAHYQESRICGTCLESIHFECWACSQRIEAAKYLEFKRDFKSSSAMCDLPAIMTNYVRSDPKQYLTLCHRCDGFFWPCDYCGSWINEG